MLSVCPKRANARPPLAGRCLTLAIVDGIWVLLLGWWSEVDIVLVYSFPLFWIGFELPVLRAGFALEDPTLVSLYVP